MSQHTSPAPQSASHTPSPHTDHAVSRRSALKAMLAAAGSAVLFGMPALAQAEPQASQETLDALDDAQEQLDAAQKQIDDLSYQFEDLSAQLDSTMGQIEGVQEQIDATQAEIDATQEDIDEKQDDIDEKQAELEEKQEYLSQRVTASYKAGDHSTLSLLLSSESFEELIATAHYIDKVNANDQENIREIHAIQEELKRQKAELEQEKEQLEAQKASLEEQKAQLESLKSQQVQQLDNMKEKKNEVQAVLDGLSQEVKDLINQRDAEILAAAQAEEEARRAAEEAARQAAAAGSSGGATSIPGDGQDAIAAGNAQQLVVQSAYSTPSPGTGLCAKWVSQVFQNAGFGYVGGNADDMYANYCTSSNKANLKVGMIIAVPSHPHTAAGRIYGHVGVYVGDNTVRDNIGYIRTINVDSWISYYGPTSTPRWGWASGINLEG